jgi:glycosidase
MHHPGPPQFAAVGETIELAPRDPDPDASYHWRVKGAPVASEASLGDENVEFFTPDAAGTYEIELDAPDGTHVLTVRVFRGEMSPIGAGGGVSGYSGMSGRSGMSGMSGMSGQSGGVSGSGSGALGSRESSGEGRPRVSLSGSVEGDEVVVRAHPTHSGDYPDEDLDVEFLLDDRDDVDRAQVTVEERAVRIPVSAFVDRVRVHGVALADTYSVADAVSVERDGDEVSVVRLNDPPEWSKSVTLYEIYVRGYASDDEEADNTFEALSKRLDYLADLGVDCIWLTPVLQNDHAPHGYNIVDFFSIAEDLGSEEDFAAFVDAAHDHDINVLFDLVLNHSGRQHPFFQDAYGNPDSEYYDWYEWQDNGEPGTYFDWEYIANFDFRNLEVRRHLLDAVDKWAEYVDGFRCDMAWAVSRPFWTEIRERLKEKDSEFLLLDETIPYIADFHELAFDIHFDTTLYFTLRQVGRGNEPAERILDAVEQRAEVGFPEHAAFMLYIENHDETRYIQECGRAEAFAAGASLFTLPGVPMLYGGQEIGQRGRRDPLAWDHADEELGEFYRDLEAARNDLDALGFDGDFGRVDYEADTDRAVAFAREADGEQYVVVLNFGAEPAAVDLAPSVDTTDAITGDSVAGDETDVSVETVAVLRAEA